MDFLGFGPWNRGARCPRIPNWGVDNTPPDGQLFLKLEVFCDMNPLKSKTSVGGQFSLCKQQPNLTNLGCVSLYKMQKIFKNPVSLDRCFKFQWIWSALDLHNQEQLSPWRGVVDPSVRNPRTLCPRYRYFCLLYPLPLPLSCYVRCVDRGRWRMFAGNQGEIFRIMLYTIENHSSCKIYPPA